MLKVEYESRNCIFFIIFAADFKNERIGFQKRKDMKEKKTTLVGWRPANEEEAIARIEAIEADIEKNGLIDEEEMIEHLKAKGLWLI